MKTAYKASGPCKYEFYFIWLIGIGYTSGIAPVGFKNYNIVQIDTLYLPFIKIQRIQYFNKAT